MGQAGLTVKNLSKRFSTTVAVNDFSLNVLPGEFVSLLGPSGCGKTTLLRIIAGYIQPDSGAIELGSRDITSLAPYGRDIGMVFQSYALFPHLTTFDNVAFGLRMRNVRAPELNQRVTEALELVQLAEFASRLPRELSGGQQQRVALARAIVIRPQLLLLDEPLSNLDAKLRKSMQIELRRLQEKIGVTTIHVTHDQEEALSLSDRVAILSDGRLKQHGRPADIYGRPVNIFVADFVGRTNLIPGRVEASEDPEGFRVVLATGDPIRVRRDRAFSDVSPGDDVWLGIRPEAVRLAPAQPREDDRDNWLYATISRCVFGGAITTIIVTTRSGLQLFVEQQNVGTGACFDLGQEICVKLSRDDAFLTR